MGKMSKTETLCPKSYALKKPKYYTSNYDVIDSGATEDGNFDVSFAKPIWFDPKLFKEGREFYQEYRFGCVTSMLVSLVMGLSFKSLLDVLVYTEKSETPKKAFWRYFHTGLHVDSWFTSDIFQKNSAGQKSIKSSNDSSISCS